MFKYINSLVTFTDLALVKCLDTDFTRFFVITSVCNDTSETWLAQSNCVKVEWFNWYPGRPYDSEKYKKGVSNYMNSKLYANKTKGHIEENYVVMRDHQARD